MCPCIQAAALSDSAPRRRAAAAHLRRCLLANEAPVDPGGRLAAVFMLRVWGLGFRVQSAFARAWSCSLDLFSFLLADGYLVPMWTTRTA